MPRDFRNETDCRPCYLDIVHGYSFLPKISAYLKHYTELDNCITAVIKQDAFAEGRKLGLLTEPEKLDLLDKAGSWTKDEEAKYKEASESLEGKRISVKKLIIPEQVAHLTALINKEESEFRVEFRDRAFLLGTTLESYCNQVASENHIFRAFFKDKKLQENVLTQDDVDNISGEEAGIFMDMYHDTHGIFTEKNLKRIAVCPFFFKSILYV